MSPRASKLSPRSLVAVAALLAAACQPAPSHPPSVELALAKAEMRWQLLRDVAGWLADSPGLERRTEAFADGLVWQAEAMARRDLEPTGQLQILRRMEASPGLFNYDNIYRIARVDSDERYLVFGKRSDKDEQTTVQILDGHPAFLAKTTLLIDLDELPVQRGKTFQMYLGGDAPAGDATWRPLPAGSRYLMVRETFGFWDASPGIYIVSRNPSTASQQPAEAPTAPDAESVLERLNALKSQWAGSFIERLRSLPANSMRAVAETAGGLKGQYGSAGRFELQADQALLITLPQGSVDYFSVQIGDEWFVTPPQPARPASVTRNRATSRQHSDGRYRYVVSAKDPGVANWLDAGDIRNGFVFCRWQGPSSATLDGAAVDASVMSTDALATHLSDLGIDLDSFTPLPVTIRPPAMRHYPDRRRP